MAVTLFYKYFCRRNAKLRYNNCTAQQVQQQNGANMQTAHYNDATDFFALFEEGDFDEQVQNGNTCTAYVTIEGVRTQAATFVYDDDTQTSGTGTWNDALL